MTMKPWHELLDTLTAPGLAFGNPRMEALATLDALTRDLTLLGGPIQDMDAALSCLSALWLRFDYFDKSHRISQELESQDGSYWHGIAHRREGDFANACYWFRRAGKHSVEAVISSRLKEKKWGTEGTIFSPVEFTRMVERGVNEILLLEIQELEWRVLFGDCLRRALGPPT